MKILVTYYSQTGNTKRVGEAIHKFVEQNHNSTFMPIKEVSSEILNNYDLLFVGAPCHNSTLAEPILKFLNSLPDSPSFKLAGFYTHSTTPPDGTERKNQLFKEWAGNCHSAFEKTSKDKYIEFLGDFNCQGSANGLIENFIHSEIVTDDEEWIQYSEEMRKHPTQADFDDAQQFAKNILDNL
ncbi:MAG: flavodoxin family protein [Promethearchaeota archaeon]